MTCIAGVVHAGRVYLAGDGASVDAYGRITCVPQPKVFRVGPCVVGGCGSWRALQLVQYAFTPPPHAPDMPDAEYLATAFVDALRECLREGGFARVENNVEEGGTYLVGYGGALWQVQSGFEVTGTLDDYDAVGAGDDLAKGALYATRGRAPRRRLRLALEAAAHHQTGVAPPFTIVRA